MRPIQRIRSRERRRALRAMLSEPTLSVGLVTRSEVEAARESMALVLDAGHEPTYRTPGVPTVAPTLTPDTAQPSGGTPQPAAGDPSTP